MHDSNRPHRHRYTHLLPHVSSDLLIPFNGKRSGHVLYKGFLELTRVYTSQVASRSVRPFLQVTPVGQTDRRVSGSTLTAAVRSLSLARWPGTLSRILYGIQRTAQTVLGIYLKRTCSRDNSASSALGILNDNALYKSTHPLTVLL